MEDKCLYPLKLDFIEHIHVYVFIIITPYTHHMHVRRN